MVDNANGKRVKVSKAVTLAGTAIGGLIRVVVEVGKAATGKGESNK